MRKYRWLTFLILFFCCGAACFLTGCQSETLVTREGFYFDTYVTISIGDSPQAEELLDEAFTLCDRYEKQLSATVEESEIFHLNHADGARVELSESTASLLRMALTYCESTDGLFDITIQPVSSLWDFRSGKAELPDRQALDSALEKVDYHNLHLEGTTAWLENGAQIDLGGIAKGYIADKVADFLREKGVTSGILNFGGNVVAIGAKPDQSPWRIGIQKPFGEAGEYVQLVEVTDSSVVTSGDYQRYFVLDGKKYHHILDPDTGYPAESDLDSATILCDDSARGDAMSTICFLLGSDQALEYLEQQEGVEGLMVLKNGQVKTTSGFLSASK